MAPSNHSKQTLFNSNAFVCSHYTQIKPSNPQMCFYPPKTLTSYTFQLQWAFALNKLNWPSIPSNVPDCIQKTQIRFSSTRMALIPSNMYSCTQNPQIWYVSTQMTLISSNMHKFHSTSSNHVFLTPMSLIISNLHNLHSTPSNQILFNSNDLTTLKCVQLHFTTSIRPSATQITFKTRKNA